jgi:Fe-S-cluster containining protein
MYWSEMDIAAGGTVPADLTCRVAPLLCAMKGTDRPAPRCIALQGTVGASVRCAIYERRPAVCQAFAISGDGGGRGAQCDRARAIWGLPPILTVTETAPAVQPATGTRGEQTGVWSVSDQADPRADSDGSRADRSSE